MNGGIDFDEAVYFVYLVVGNGNAACCPVFKKVNFSDPTIAISKAMNFDEATSSAQFFVVRIGVVDTKVFVKLTLSIFTIYGVTAFGGFIVALFFFWALRRFSERYFVLFVFSPVAKKNERSLRFETNQ